MIWQQRKSSIQIIYQDFESLCDFCHNRNVSRFVSQVWSRPNDNIYGKLYFPVPFDGQYSFTVVEIRLQRLNIRFSNRTHSHQKHVDQSWPFKHLKFLVIKINRKSVARDSIQRFDLKRFEVVRNVFSLEIL